MLLTASERMTSRHIFRGPRGIHTQPCAVQVQCVMHFLQLPLEEECMGGIALPRSAGLQLPDSSACDSAAGQPALNGCASCQKRKTPGSINKALKEDSDLIKAAGLLTALLQASPHNIRCTFTVACV